jgi:lysophospholipase L1-like esterase
MNNTAQKQSNDIFLRHPGKTLATAVFLLTALILFGAEKILSLTQPVFNNSGIQRYIRLKEHPPLGKGYVAPTADQSAASDSPFEEQYHFEIDEDGFIYPSRIHANPDLSIVFLGGSTTESIFVDEKKRFPYLTGNLLENSGKKVNAYNGGVSGNHSMHSLNILLNKVLAIQPDIVILMHAINDLAILVYEGSYWNQNPYRSQLISQTPSTQFYNSAKAIKDYLFPNLYMALKSILHLGNDDEFAHVRHKKLDIPDSRTLTRAFEQSLRTFIHVCEIADISPVLMTQANRIIKEPDPSISREIGAVAAGLGMDYDRYRELYDSFNDTVRDVAHEEGILLIDLAMLVPSSSTYIYDAVHLNEEGSHLVADIISNALQSYLIQPDGQ